MLILFLRRTHTVGVLLLLLSVGLPSEAQDWSARWTYTVSDPDHSILMGQSAFLIDGETPESSAPVILSSLLTSAGDDSLLLLRLGLDGELLDLNTLGESVGSAPRLVVKNNRYTVADARATGFKDYSSIKLLRLREYDSFTPLPDPVWSTGFDERLLNCTPLELHSLTGPGVDGHYLALSSGSGGTYYDTEYTITHLDEQGGYVASWSHTIAEGRYRLLPWDHEHVFDLLSFESYGDYTSHAILTCRNPTGGVQWSIDVAEEVEDDWRSWWGFATTPEGIVVVSNGEVENGYLTQVDLTGEILWEISFPLEQCRNVLPLDDGSFVVTDRLPDNSNETRLVHLDPSGTILRTSEPVTLRYPVDLLAGPDHTILLTSTVYGGDPYGVLALFDDPGTLSVDPGKVAEPVVPVHLTLQAVYPNPFNATASATVVLPTPSPLTVTVFNVLGRPVRVLHDGPATPGSHRFSIDGRGLASGTYLLRAETGDQAQVRRMTLVK